MDGQLHKTEDPESFSSSVGSEPIYEGDECILESGIIVHENREAIYEGEVIIANKWIKATLMMILVAGTFGFSRLVATMVMHGYFIKDSAEMKQFRIHFDVYLGKKECFRVIRNQGTLDASGLPPINNLEPNILRLWFKTNLKLCKIRFDMGEYGRMSKKASSTNIENRSKKKYNHLIGSHPLSYIV
ncbi:MINDY deubiquitinase domain-containing protein [Forsythia ovata]|uniref:MINDY deubiquitinase domain-containing protein n=1 Tax=Forsythia ovata TaxID=205694 RepID=A0ABD1UV42_9LAMI